MHFVSPNAGKQFYLCTLLTVVKGPTSYADLYKYNNVIYPTYYEACLARALLQDDGEWRLCLSESSEMKIGHQLQHLFVIILTCCAPSDPARLWNEFRHYITDNIVPKLHTLGITDPSVDDHYDYDLYLLDRILAKTGKSLHQNYPSMLHVEYGKPWTIFRLLVHIILVIFFYRGISVFNQHLHTEIYVYTCYITIILLLITPIDISHTHTYSISTV